MWAYDNLSEQFKIVSQTGDVYDVQYTAHGSFAALADPTTGGAAASTGDGYHVPDHGDQPYGPNAANLPTQMPPALGSVPR